MVDLSLISSQSELIDEALSNQVKDVFDKLENPIVIKAVIQSGEKSSDELAPFLKVITGLSEKLELELYNPEEAPEELNQTYLPVTGLYCDGQYSRVSFHGVPGGKEMNAFILGIYNLAGPGQDIARGLVKKIRKIQGKVNIKVCVSLGCQHCSKSVIAAHRMAMLNENIHAEMIDARLYPELIERYNIERVPMIIVNDQEIGIGKTMIEDILEIVKKVTK